jgi:hypothetical protein
MRATGTSPLARNVDSGATSSQGRREKIQEVSQSHRIKLANVAPSGKQKDVTLCDHFYKNSMKYSSGL